MYIYILNCCALWQQFITHFNTAFQLRISTLAQASPAVHDEGVDFGAFASGVCWFLEFLEIVVTHGSAFIQKASSQGAFATARGAKDRHGLFLSAIGHDRDSCWEHEIRLWAVKKLQLFHEFHGFYIENHFDQFMQRKDNSATLSAVHNKLSPLPMTPEHVNSFFSLTVSELQVLGQGVDESLDQVLQKPLLSCEQFTITLQGQGQRHQQMKWG